MPRSKLVQLSANSPSASSHSLSTRLLYLLPRIALSLSRKFLLSVASLCLIGAVGLLLCTQLDLTIHSCDIYSPGVIPAVTGVSRALTGFFQVEGVYMLFETLWQLIRMEIFRDAPFYSRESVADKYLLVLGGSYIPEFFDTARRLGVKVVVVDDDSRAEQMKGQATHYISVDDYPRVSITDPAAVIAEIEKSSAGIKFDGVTTLVEDQGPLVARVAKHFKLVGSSEGSADVARNKLLFRNQMRDKNVPSPRFYAVNSEEDLEKAAKHVGLPGFLKPVFGVAAAFASTVNTMEELRQTYRLNQQAIDPKNSPIYHYGLQMILESIMTGPEVQLEMMLYDGEVVFHCFSSEYSPKRDFVVFPSNLTQHQKDEMLKVAKQTVKAIGLTWGVVHLEMFNEPTGPQVIEVNNRLSRGFLPQQYFHQLLFGEKVVDYFGSVIFLAFGLRPPSHPRSHPVASIAVFPDGRSEVGWETTGSCALFVGNSPHDALQQGKKWAATGRKSHSRAGVVALLMSVATLLFVLSKILAVLAKRCRPREKID